MDTWLRYQLESSGEGLFHVRFVNGQIIVENDELTGDRNGRVLRNRSA